MNGIKKNTTTSMSVFQFTTYVFYLLQKDIEKQ